MTGIRVDLNDRDALICTLTRRINPQLDTGHLRSCFCANCLSEKRAKVLNALREAIENERK